MAPLTIETIPVSPKNEPPTKTRILALCHSFACIADQHPSDIARNIAPRNLVASSFTGQGQYGITAPGEIYKTTPSARLISERASRNIRPYLPRWKMSDVDVLMGVVSVLVFMLCPSGL